MRTNTNKGFTLIELLVVIAIIGLLATVVMTSLNSARQKGRDARRLADIDAFRSALEMYYDANTRYPNTLAELKTNGYMSDIPKDPLTGNDYNYWTATTTGAGYVLGATLENPNHKALKLDLDGTAVRIGTATITVACDDPVYCVRD